MTTSDRASPIRKRNRNRKWKDRRRTRRFRTNRVLPMKRASSANKPNRKRNREVARPTTLASTDQHQSKRGSQDDHNPSDLGQKLNDTPKGDFSDFHRLVLRRSDHHFYGQGLTPILWE